MNLVPYRFQRPFEDLFDAFQNRFSNWTPVKSNEENDFWAPFSFDSFSSTPKVDVEDTDDAFLVRAEVPGLDKDDIHVDLNQDRLIIKGEKKHESKNKGKNYYRVECSYGSFSRTIPLPSEVEEEKVNAEYKNGVLNICLPKRESAKKKSIEINVAS